MTNQTLHTSPQEGALFRAILFLLISLWATTFAFATSDPPSDHEQQAFLEKISRIAKAEQQSSGIPASITAAQAIFESSWGKSRLAATGNNYFGIKCKSWWVGDSIMHQDDDYNELGELTYSCFRAYECIEDSFTDHSIFLLSSERYAPLFRLDPTDYKAWAHGLKKCGYATDPQYAEKIIGLIERLNLQKLDQIADVNQKEESSGVESSNNEILVDSFGDSSESLPPPPTPIPDSYVPSGKGERPMRRIY